jgi:hypothetical protein
MKPNIFEPVEVLGGTIAPMRFYGEWDVLVTRADGREERKTLRNTITANGMNRIANRAVQATGTTPFFTILVGTISTAPADTDGQPQFGEMIRKTSLTLGANAQSREWIFLTCTLAGAVDGITSKTMNCAGICDFPTSHASSGVYGNRVNGLGTTLADSDFLFLTCRIRCGSHNQAHTT